VTAIAGRLGVHVSQETFRALLDTLSRPGTIVSLPTAPNGVPAALLPALALSDVEVKVRVLAEDGPEWESVIATATGAPRAATTASADLVTALDSMVAEEILSLGRGTAMRPEDGARLVLAVEYLDLLVDGAPASSETVVLRLEGPGIPGVRRLAVMGLAPGSADAIAATRRSYPAGIDVHLVTPEGRVASVPRSSRVEIERLVGSDR